MQKKEKDYTNTYLIYSTIPGLQYDINALLKSFFPAKEVRVIEVDELGNVLEQVHDQEILNQPVFMKVGTTFAVARDVDHSFSIKDNETQVDVQRDEIQAHGDSVGMAIEFEFMYDPNAGSNEKLSSTEKASTDSLSNTASHFPCTFICDIDPALGLKDTIKRRFYDVLCEVTGRKLPWGNLSGVRPTKIAMTMINEGALDEEIKEHLTKAHRVSEEKISLSLKIAHKEKELIDKLDCEKGYSLYIGIPFCPTTCLYCSFTSYPIVSWSKRLDDYLDALYKEIDYVANEYAMKAGTKKNPDTIYIGGGTPTSLDEVHLEKLLEKITFSFDMEECKEFTCEAGRPDSITKEKLEIMQRYGVTRISVNPQTMQQKTLDLIGRRTTVEQVVDTYKMAREVGLDNINMDIILGLPGEDVDDVRDTLDKICEMNPDSLTVHSLAIKRASALKQRLDEIGVESLKNTDETMQLASEAATKMNMEPYYLYRQKNMSGNFENTGFARPGKEGLYNILIMEEVQTIVACGAGTVSKHVYPDGRITRCENMKDVSLYMDKIDEMIDRKRELFKD